MASRSIPKTMRALVAPKYCKPDGYEIMEVPVPEIREPDEVLIRIYAAGLFFGDAQHAEGSFRMLFSTSFPIILGRTGSGIVAAVGRGVTSLRPGDAVYGVGMKRPLARFFSDGSRGWAAEYAITTADLLLIKPSHLSFEEAAAPLGNTVTAIQITREAAAMSPVVFSGSDGSLEGKTVLVTAGLGASTSVAAQYAKNVMKAKKVIVTVSSAKVLLVDDYLGPGTVDQVVDYQAQDIVEVVGKGEVDLLYCSRPDLWSYLPVMSQGGVIAAILGVPSSKVLAEAMGEGVLPFWMRWGLDIFQWWYRWKLWGTGVQMKFVSGNLGAREDLELAGEYIAKGQVKGVYTGVSMDNLEAIKQGCMEARSLKGRIGKLVVTID